MNDGPESASHLNLDANSDTDTDHADRDLASAGGAGGLCEGDAAAGTAELEELSSLFGVGPGAGSGSGNGGGPVMDEVALRRMLRGAVQHIGPSDGTLDRLHRAVPARRARRRQAVVGMAAAALLIGTAVPAFVHVANSDGGSNTANPAIAGHGEQAQGGSGIENGSEADGEIRGGSTEGQADGGRSQPTSTSSPSDSRGQSADGKVGGGADPANSAAVSVPACGPGQLGVASAETGAAGVDGTVYGRFRIANVSGTDCSVSSSGSVGFQAMGAADPAEITVVQHTAGDAAAGLPDPSQEQGTVLLKPAMWYEVQFAWVPRNTCPTSGGSPSPTPTDGAGGAAGTDTGAADGTTDTTAQLGSEDGGGALDGSISVTHTPEAGAPVAETKIADACAGTIYRTGLLAPAT